MIMNSDVYMTTYTGRWFYPFAPCAEDVSIEDIAHSLSLQCCFSGHTRTFYSVAEHCIIGSYFLKGLPALQFLLHHAAQAYLVDVPGALKRHPLFGWSYRRAERRLMRVIAEACRLPHPFDFSVTVMDERMRVTEQRDLITNVYKRGAEPWTKVQPIAGRVGFWTPETAKRVFLDRWLDLDNERIAAQRFINRNNIAAFKRSQGLISNWPAPPEQQIG